MITFFSVQEVRQCRDLLKFQEPGIYTVTLSLDGYEDAVKTVIISDDATSTVTADLKQKSGTTATTAAKSPFPVLGILAGLGAAAFFLRRR